MKCPSEAPDNHITCFKWETWNLMSAKSQVETIHTTWRPADQCQDPKHEIIPLLCALDEHSGLFWIMHPTTLLGAIFYGKDIVIVHRAPSTFIEIHLSTYLYLVKYLNIQFQSTVGLWSSWADFFLCYQLEVLSLATPCNWRSKRVSRGQWRWEFEKKRAYNFFMGIFGMNQKYALLTLARWVNPHTTC